MKDLRITLVQAPLAWEDRAANRAYFSRVLGGLRKGRTDLILLPEMFNTGFTMNAAAMAETMRGPTVAWMRETASRCGAVLCGSLIIRERRRYFNRLVWMPPSGRCRTYDKRHLFGMAHEERTYSPGRRKLVVELNGWRIMPLVCYDLRFPVWSRQPHARPYDVLVYVANWPSRRRFAWSQLLVARAIENQCYVAAVNRTGNDGNGIVHPGASAVIDPAGKRISRHAGGKPFIETVTCSHRDLLLIRRYMPFLRDADRFQLLEP